MGVFVVKANQDIIQQLFLLDLRHILDNVLSYLDMETLSNVEMVSPLWAWLVHSSNYIYRRKVNCVLKLLQIPNMSGDQRSYHNSLHSNLEREPFVIVNRSLF